MQQDSIDIMKLLNATLVVCEKSSTLKGKFESFEVGYLSIVGVWPTEDGGLHTLYVQKQYENWRRPKNVPQRTESISV